MLQHLQIQNYALIRQLEMKPVGGLNIITGETGAGKSILLGAVGLLLGNRADTRVLFDESVKCIIEGQFDIRDYHLNALFDQEELEYDEETIIRREISPSGKSRAFINDTPVTLDVLTSLGSRLMDIHSQHESQLLGKSDFQMNLLDAYADVMGERDKYADLYRSMRVTSKKLSALREERSVKEKEADYQQFIFEELNGASLKTGEQEELEGELATMEHAEEIKTKFEQITQLLSEGEFPALPALQEARTQLLSIRKYSKVYDELHGRLESAFLELEDLATEIHRQYDAVDYDPEKTEALQDRLSMIYQLQQKHHVRTIEELLEIRERLEAETHHVMGLDEEISGLEKGVAQLREQVTKAAADLSEKRKKAIPGLEKELILLLQKVGIPEADVAVTLEPAEPGPFGSDTIRLLFSANKGISPQPLARVASGGEFSRFMFCIKHILADKVALPTIIFDEIDTGVSGEVAIKMGEMMKFMANNHQVISISHLPQIAAKADRHFFVYKDSTADTSISRIRTLNEDERVEEIAKMIGGDRPTDTARQSARELLTQG